MMGRNRDLADRIKKIRQDFHEADIDRDGKLSYEGKSFLKTFGHFRC